MAQLDFYSPSNTLVEHQMSKSAWTTHPDSPTLDVLRVPSQAQPETEPECLPYSMWMCIHYIAEWYPIDWVRDETRKIDAETLVDLLTIRQSGWIPDGDDLERVSQECGPIQFKHRFWETSPTSTGFFDLLERKLEKDLPTITIIDDKFLREGISGDGPVHAVTVTGINDSKVAYNDPWGHAHMVVDKHQFADAWDARNINQIIKVDIVEQSTLQQPLPEADSE